MPFERSSFFLLFVGLATCVAAYGGVRFARPEYVDLVNMTMPLVMGLMLLYVGYRNVLHNHLLIWTPLPYFLGSCALFFGLGPTLYHFGSEELIWKVGGAYAIKPQELLRTNMLNATCILLVVVVYYYILRLVASVRTIVPDRPESSSSGIIQLKIGAIFFLSIGLPAKYLITLPARYNIYDVTVHGLVYQLENVIPMSLVMLCILAHRCGGIWRVLFYSVAVAELFTGLLSFAKVHVLITLIMLTLGYFAVNPRPRTLVAGFCATVIAYVLLMPLALYGRGEAGEFAEGAGLAERFEVFQNYLSDDRREDEDGEAQGWWGRLSYARYQAFVMAEYDAGRPGETVELALYVPIPRALWPDKPDIAVGRDFNYLMTGFRTTQIAAGIFAEAYWNGGWLLVIFVCAYVGMLFAGFTSYSLRRIALQQFFFLPVVFLGIKVSLSPAGWFAVSYVGDVLNSILMHFALVAILAVIPTRRLFSPRPA